MMKLAILTIALVCAVTAQEAKIYATFLPSIQNAWNVQYLQVENSLENKKYISDVSFTVVASQAPRGAKIGFFFDADETYYGEIGAIVGRANGTGSFYVNGQAGTYELTIVATWLRAGVRKTTFGKFPYTIVSNAREIQESNDDLIVEFNNDAQYDEVAMRDGSNNDMSGTATAFYGIQDQVTWNQFRFKAGSVALYGITFTYTPNDVDNFGCAAGNNSKNIGANKEGAADFTIYGAANTAANPTYYVTIKATYRKTNPVSGPTGTWTATYPFSIQASGAPAPGKRSEVKSILAQQIDQIENNQSAKSSVAIVAAVAGVACVAAVAIVAAVVIIRRKQTTSVSA